MRFAKELTLVAVALLVAAMSVFAAPGTPDGATLTIGPGETYTGGATAATGVNASGGNFTYLNATAPLQTDNWQIFYGSVSGNLVLQDASSNAAYTWSPDNTVTGHIFFSNESTVAWPTLDGLDSNVAQLQQENNQLGLGAASDNITETFSAAPAHPVINFTGHAAGIASGATWAVQTNNESAQADWDTALTYTASAVVYVGFINQSGKTSFNGETVDYQVMVPTSNGGVRQYWVFLAIE
ncbi:hypothetical protein H6504_02590 [Candidatus Woesearchaeota archaeon]|nr:hypothetical protein [Candidatus Woesearchaeota archaeon]